MGDLHDRLEEEYAEELRADDFKTARPRMDGWVPDIFAHKTNRDGKVTEEVVVEVETHHTLLHEQTTRQLVALNRYVEKRRRTLRKVSGILLVEKKILRDALLLLFTLFGVKHCIRIVVK